MYWQRIVEIYSAEQGGHHGSGYLIAQDLVLTSYHVVEKLQTTEMRLLEADKHGLPGKVGPWQPARVVWVDEELDLALLAADQKFDKFTSLTGTTTFGRIDSRVPAPVRVHAVGFPRAVKKPAYSDTLELTASVSPWSIVRSGSLLLSVEGAQPAAAEDWKGMSGAAVFAGDRLVGIIRAVPTKLDEGLFAATAHPILSNEIAKKLLIDAGVAPNARFVDAAYVDALPPAGHWGGLREQYARAVIESLCSLDDLGLAVSGVLERRVPALSAFTAQRLRLWQDDTTVSR